jgi:hypothetical protein
VPEEDDPEVNEEVPEFDKSNEQEEGTAMGWNGIGNPQPGHIRDESAPAMAIAKATFAKKNKQATVKGRESGK